MLDLGNIYKDVEKYEMAEKYYLIAAEKNNTVSLYNIGCIYKICQNILTAIKYFLLAIENGCVNSMKKLGKLYKEINNYDLAIQYFKLAIQHTHSYDKELIDKMSDCGNLGKKEFFESIKNENKIKELEKTIQLVGEGYLSAKDHYDNLVKNNTY